MEKNFKHNLVFFFVMFIFGMLLNAMNILAYNISDIYFSLTLVYVSLYMASNMLWIHEVVSYINYNIFNLKVFVLGLLLSMFFVMMLRTQLFVTDSQWLRRMITHHSTAITTSDKILKKTKNIKIKKLAQSIIDTQKKEINLMKDYLNK